MLKKLLRYDLKSVFKYWWIAAVASLGLSVAGGFCISVINAEKDVPTFIMVLVVLALLFTILGISAFSILSYILVYVRFYKNFFTDEGYLTFTLPVKRSQLLNSKLLTSVITSVCTALVLFIDIISIVIIGFWSELVSDTSVATTTDVSAYVFLYILEFIIIALLFCAFSALFMFACITFASVITKKAKVITAIGIYYVANGIISGFVQIVYIFGVMAIENWLSELPTNMHDPVIAIILLGVILFLALICLLLYALEYFMLDRKLNLS